MSEAVSAEQCGVDLPQRSSDSALRALDPRCCCASNDAKSSSVQEWNPLESTATLSDQLTPWH
jgi:hypothetical protein